VSRKPKPKPPTKGVILPPELDDDDDEIAGGGIPDADGNIYLRRSKGERRGKNAKKEKPAQ